MTQGPSGLHQLSGILRSGPVVSWMSMALTVSLNWWLLLPEPLCFVHACAVCMGRVCVCHVLAHLTLLGPAPFFYPGEKVMADDEFTQDLFRFLQLLCEGHNNGEQGWVEWRGG